MASLVETTCAFCDYDGPVVADYGDVVIIEPLEPVTIGHVLVIPKAHVPSALASLDISALTMRTAVWHANVTGIGACNFITSHGPQASQTVFHLHMHIIPRREGDGLRLPWTRGGNMTKDLANLSTEQAQAQHDAYMRTAGWALDQAAAIDREYDLPLTKDDEDAMLTEIARHGGPQADRNLVEGKTQSLGRVLDGLAEES